MLFVNWLQRLLNGRRNAASKRKPNRVAPGRRANLQVRRLEPRRVLNGLPLVAVDQLDAGAGFESGTSDMSWDDLGGSTVDAGPHADDGQDDIFSVGRDGNDVVVELDGNEIFRGALEDVDHLRVLGSGDNDTLMLEMGDGDSLPAIEFLAGEQASPNGDTVVVTGAGDWDVGGAGASLTFSSDTGSTTVTLESVEGTEIVTDSLTYSGQHDFGGGSLFAQADSLVVADAAEIESAGGRVELSAGESGTVTVAGAIDVSSPTGIGGDVLVLGHDVELAGGASIDASGESGGGEILIGGDRGGLNPDVINSSFTHLGEGSTLSADAIHDGDGGRIIVWADDTTTAEGTLSAHGGDVAGNGGFIEVSGKASWWFPNWLSSVNVSAANGDGGTFLIDPNDIGIVDALLGTSVPPLVGSPTASNLLADADVANFLQNTGSLVIETTGTGGNGDVTIDGAVNITWSTANTLTINADRHIVVTAGATIDAGASGTANLNATNDFTAGALNIGGGINVNAVNATFDTVNGTSSGAGDLTINATTAQFNGNVGSTNAIGTLATQSGGTLQINTATVTVDSNIQFSGSVVVNPTGDSTATLTSATGTIDFQSTGNLTLTSGDNLVLVADTTGAASDIDIDSGTVTGNGGTISFRPSSNSLNIEVGSTANPSSLDIDAATIANLSGFGVIEFGSATQSGIINVAATSNLTFADSVNLNAAQGGVTFADGFQTTGASDIKVAALNSLNIGQTLATGTGGNIDVSSVNVITLSGRLIGGGDGTSVIVAGDTVGFSGGADGSETIVNTGTGTVTVEAASMATINLDGFAIQAGTGEVRLDSAGAITATANADPDIQTSGPVSLISNGDVGALDTDMQVDIQGATELRFAGPGDKFIDGVGSEIPSLVIDPASGQSFSVNLSGYAGLTGFNVSSDGMNLSINALIYSGTQDISLEARTGNVSVTGVNTGNQNFTLTTLNTGADGGNVGLADGAIASGAGAITINASGSISENMPGTANNLTAATINLNAENGIGSLATDDAIDVTNPAGAVTVNVNLSENATTADNVTGGVFINSVGATIFGGTNNGNAASTVVANSPLTVNATATAVDMSFVAANSIANNDHLTIAGNVQHTGGPGVAKTLEFLAGDNIIHNSGLVSFQNANVADLVRFRADTDGGADGVRGGITQAAAGGVTAATVAFRADQAVSFAAGTNTVNTISANVTGAAQGFSYADTDGIEVGTADSLAGITTNGGNIAVTANGTDTLFRNRQAIQSNGGNITLIGDNIELAESVDSRVGLVTLTTTNDVQGILVGATAADSPTAAGLRDAELDQITSTGGVTIGSATNDGGITVVGVADQATAATITGGTFTLQQDTGNISINNVLTNSINTTLTSNSGNISFGNPGHVIATGMAVTLSAMAGNISATANNVDVTAGSVALNSSNGVGAAGSPIRTASPSIRFANTNNEVHITNSNGGTTNDFSGSQAGSGIVTLVEALGNLRVGAPSITTAGGEVHLMATSADASIQTIATQNIDTTNAGGAPAGAAVLLQADNVDLAGSINAATGIVTVQSFSGGANIAIGDNGANAADNTVRISDAELETLNTRGGIVIDASTLSNGNIAISHLDPVNLAMAHLTLIAGGEIRDNGDAAAIITLGNGTLTLDSDTGIGGNRGTPGALGINVTSLAARTRADVGGAGGDIAISNDRAFAIDTALNTGASFSIATADDTNGGNEENIYLETTSGAITFNSSLTAVDQGSVTVNSAGAIMDANAMNPDVVGNDVSLEAVGDIAAIGAGNALSIRAAGTTALAATGSDMFITSDMDLFINDLVTAAGADLVQISTTGAANLTLDGALGYVDVATDAFDLDTATGTLTIQNVALNVGAFDIDTSGGNVNITANVSTTATNAVNVNAMNGTSTVSGIVSGGGGLVKGGNGTMTVSGNNTFAGATAVDGGQLTVTHANGLGTNAGDTSVATGATLLLNSVTVADSISLNGGRLNAAGAGGGVNGNVTFSIGPVSIGGAGTLAITGTVNGSQDLTIDGSVNTDFQGAVGGGASQEIGDGTGAAINLRSSGSTQFQSTVETLSGITQDNTAGAIRFDDNVTIATGTAVTTLNGNVQLDGLTFTAGGTINFGNAATDTLSITGGPVTIDTSAVGAQVAIASTTTLGADLTISAGSAPIRISGTVNGPNDLMLNSTAINTIAGELGGIAALASVTTNAGGSTNLGANITANGTGITFGDNLNLTADVTITELNNSNVTFNDVVNGNQNLVVNTSGITDINGVVGAGTALNSLTTDAGGRTEIGADISAQGGTMTFNDAVVLTSDTTLTDTGGTGITFNSTVDTAAALVAGAGDLRLIVSGATTFVGAVGSNAISGVTKAGLGSGTGTSLSIESPGTTRFQSTLSTASGFTQSDTAGELRLDDNVSVANNNMETFLNANVRLDGLTFVSAGLVEFGNAATDTLTISTALVTIDTSVAGAFIRLNAVTILGSDLTLSAGTGNIRLNGAIDGNNDLVLNSSALTAINASIGQATPVSSLTTDAGGVTGLEGNISAQGGTLTFNDPVVLVSDVTLTDTGGTGVTFNSTVDTAAGLATGDGDLTLVVTGATNFVGAVGSDALGATTKAELGSGTGAAITINSPGTTRFQSTVQAASGLTQLGTAGDVRFDSDVTLSAGDVGSTLNADVQLDGLTFASAGDVTFGDAPTDTLAVSTAATEINTSSGSATLDINSATSIPFNLTVDVGTNTASSIDGVISGNGALVKNGTGTVTLTAANTYTGASNISAGTLAVDGSIADGTGTVQVANGGTLAGIGIVFEDVNVASGGTISPAGDAIGILTLANTVQFADGASVLHIDIAGLTSGTQYDVLNVTSAAANSVTLNSATVQHDFNSPFIPMAGNQFVYVNATSNNALVGEFNGFADGASGLVSGLPARLFYNTLGDGNDTGLLFDGGAITITDSDTFFIARDRAMVKVSSDDPRIVALPNILGSVAIASATGITIDGDTGNDSLTLINTNFANDYLGAIQFDGGVGSDLINIEGTDTFNLVSYIFEDMGVVGTPQSGSITLDADGAGGTAGFTLTYTGLEPIIQTISVENVELTYSDGTETITVAQDVGTPARTLVTSTISESLSFENPTQTFTLNSGGGDDTININGFGTGTPYVAQTTINGQLGTDSITLNTSLNLSGGDSSAVFTAESITLAASVTTNGGAITLTGDVVLGADVVLDTDSTTDGNVSVTGTVEADAEANNRDLTVRAGTADISFGSTIGLVEAMNDLNIDSADDVTITGTLSASGNVTQRSGTGTTAFNGSNTSGGTLTDGIDGTLSVTTDTITFSTGGVVTGGNVSLQAQNAVTFNAGTGLDASAGAIDIDVNLDDAGAESFLMDATVAIITTNATAAAININVDGTGSATVSSVSAGGTVTVNTRNTANTGGGAISAVDAADATADITGTTLDLDAATGITLEVTASSIAADSLRGDVTLDNIATAATTVTSVTTGVGNIDFGQTGGQTLTVTTAVTADGSIVLANDRANMEVTSATAGGANNITLTTTTSGTITVGNINASGDLITVTSAGALNEDATADGTADLTATTVDLNAVTGIGNTAPIEVNAASISADTTNGSINIGSISTAASTTSSLTTGTGDISLNQLGGNSLTVTLATTTDGDIAITNDSATLVVTTATAGGAGQNVTLTTTTSGGITVGAVTADGDTVTITSAGDINEDAAADTAADVVAATIDLNAASGIGNSSALELTGTSISANTSNGNVDLNSLATAAVTVTSLTTGTGDISFTQTGGQQLTVTNAATNDGDITMSNDSGDLVATTVAAGGAGQNASLTTTTSGDVSIGSVTALDDDITVTSAGAINEDASDDAGADIVGSTIDLNASTGIGSAVALELTGASISADTTNGNVNFNSVATGAVLTSSLTTGTGDISFNQTGGQQLTVTTATTTDGAITLTNDGSDLIAETITAGGAGQNVSISTTKFGDVTLQAVTAVDDLVTVTSAGSINESTSVDGAADVVAGTIDLNANTGIGNTAPFDVTGGSISADTTNGNIVLTSLATVPVTLASMTSGTGDVSFDQSGGQSLNVTTAATTNGDVMIRNAGGNLTVSTVTAGGAGQNVALATTTTGNVVIDDVQAVDDTITINSAGSIEENPDATVDLTANNLILVATQGIGEADPIETRASRLQATNNLGPAPAMTTGRVRLDNTGAGQLTISGTGVRNSTPTGVNSALQNSGGFAAVETAPTITLTADSFQLDAPVVSQFSTVNSLQLLDLTTLNATTLNVLRATTLTLDLGSPGDRGFNVLAAWGDVPGQSVSNTGTFDPRSPSLNVLTPVAGVTDGRFTAEHRYLFSAIRNPAPDQGRMRPGDPFTIQVRVTHPSIELIESGTGNNLLDTTDTLTQASTQALIPAGLAGGGRNFSTGGEPIFFALPTIPPEFAAEVEADVLLSTFTDIVDVSIEAGVGEIGRLVLRFLYADGSQDFDIPFSILSRDNLKALFGKLPDGHIQVVLIRADETEVIFVDQYLRDGRPYDPKFDSSQVEPSETDGDKVAVIEDAEADRAFEDAASSTAASVSPLRLAADAAQAAESQTPQIQGESIRDESANQPAPTNRVLRIDAVPTTEVGEEVKVETTASSAAVGVVALASIRSGLRRRIRETEDEQASSESSLGRIRRMLRRSQNE